MELLLNFLWLMLALPAFVVWRQHLVSSHFQGKAHHSRSLLLLGCLLVLLFPAVSASDDLHPISAEIEESSAFKRNVKQSPGIKAPAFTDGHSWAALPVQTAWSQPVRVTLGSAPVEITVLPRQVSLPSNNTRAPPKA
jgi:hypothetical protein